MHAGISCQGGCEHQELTPCKEFICLCGKKSDCNICGGTRFYKSDQCINEYIDSNAVVFYKSYFKNKEGILPNPGGYLDQSNGFFENVKFFDSVIHAWDEVRKERRGNG